MKFRPLHDRVVFKRSDAEAKSAGGIIIPDTAQEKPMEAKVVALGSGKLLDDGTRQKFEVKKGDRIIIDKYSGTEVNYNDEEFILVREDGILAILK